jgi:hypothetical protein
VNIAINPRVPLNVKDFLTSRRTAEVLTSGWSSCVSYNVHVIEILDECKAYLNNLLTNT